MNLASLTAAISCSLPLIRPDGQDTGIVLEIASRDHPVMKEHARKLIDKRMAASARRGSVVQPRAEDMESETIEAIATAILGWTGMEKDGESWPWSHENAVALVTAHPWIRRRVDEAMGDEARFFGV